MFEKMKDILKENYRITELDPEARFRTDLGLNSFDLMNLLCIAEETFKVQIEEERYREIETVAQLCDYLSQLVASDEV